MASRSAEEKLDIALAYLAKKNEGSYLYPEKIDLFDHMTKQGIPENEHLPILLHLQWGEYVSLFYEDGNDKIRGEFPNQIKITFKGIKFNDKGGYTKHLCQQKLKRIGSTIITWVTVLTFLGVLISLWLQYRAEKHEEERWRIDHIAIDTVYVHDTLRLGDDTITKVRR
ncbi:MAG: hypothetical protein L6Q81_07510 [Bacteroidia bacterium]|nr:hypothetical protein [Bacteroidia bacterium]